MVLPLLKRLVLIVLALCCNPVLAEDEAIARIFAAEGVEGTFVLQSLHGKQTITHHDERASLRFASASTFKIFNTLIGVELQAVRPEGKAFQWDGTRHDFPDWNQDHTLASAFKVSCVWCYQAIARQVGEDAYRRYLALANYGALNGMPDVTTFWLDGSLTVSAIEQVAFLQQVYLRQLPFRDEAYDALRQVMLSERADRYALFAKTGWAARVTPSIGWYVGYVETADDVWFFATNLTLRSDSDLGLRQKISKAALQAKGVIP